MKSKNKVVIESGLYPGNYLQDISLNPIGELMAYWGDGLEKAKRFGSAFQAATSYAYYAANPIYNPVPKLHILKNNENS